MPADQPTRFGKSDRAPSLPIEERRAIGKLLHDGILQDLTVLGFELSTLGRDVPPALRPKVVELAARVASRQSALRELVSELVTDERVK